MDIANLALTPSTGEKVDRRAITSLPPGVLEQRIGEGGLNQLDALVQEAELQKSGSRRKLKASVSHSGRPRSGGPFMDAARFPEIVVASPEHTTRIVGMDSPDRGPGVVPIDPHEEPVLLGGNLQKMGKILKGWHQRYFEVQGHHMYYYKDSNKRQCLGEVNLDIAFHCGPCSAATFGNPFEIRTLQRNHIFAARTYEEMQLWITTIMANMGISAEEAKKAKKGGKSRQRPKRSETFSTTNAYTTQTSQASQKSELSIQSVGGKKRGFFARIRGRGAEQSKPRSSTTPLEAMSIQPKDPEVTPVPSPEHRPASSLSDEQPSLSNLEKPDPTPAPRSLPGTPVATRRETQERESSETLVVTESGTAPPSAIEGEGSGTAPPSAIEGEGSSAAPPSAIEGEKVSVSITSNEILSNEPTATKVEKPEKPETVPPRVQVQPEQSERLPTPDILKKKYVFDQIREMLDSLPENTKASSYEQLPPQDQTWLNQPTGIEQLRVFLAVCT